MKYTITIGLLGVMLGVIACGDSIQEILEVTHPALRTEHVIYADSNYAEYPLKRNKVWYWEATVNGNLWEEMLLSNRHNKLLIKCQGFGPSWVDSDSAFLLLEIWTHVYTVEGRTDFSTIDIINKGNRADRFDSTYWYIWEFPSKEIDSLRWAFENSYDCYAYMQLWWWELK